MASFFPAVIPDHALSWIAAGAGKLARSLLNTTLLLAILLSITGIVLIGKVQGFVTEVLSGAGLQILQDVDSEIAQVSRQLRDGEHDLQTIATRLDDIVRHPEIALSPETKQAVLTLRHEVSALNRNLEALSSSREALSDRAIRTIATAFSEAWIKVRHCQQMGPTHKHAHRPDVSRNPWGLDHSNSLLGVARLQQSDPRHLLSTSQ